MSISLRGAEAADLAAITDIYAHAVRHGTASYEIDPPSLGEMTQRFDALWRSGHPAIVAKREAKVLGYAYAGPFRPRPAYRFTVEDSVYVAPDAQGQGVGRLLLSGLVEECRKKGFRQILAVIGDGHKHSPSVILHEKLGFRFCGLIEGSGFKHGRWLDTALMQLAVNGGTSTLPEG